MHFHCQWIVREKGPLLCPGALWEIYTCCLVAVSSAFQFIMPAPWKWLFDSRQCANPFVFVKENVTGSSLFALCCAFGFLSWSIVCIIHCIHSGGEHKQSQTTSKASKRSSQKNFTCQGRLGSLPQDCKL